MENMIVVTRESESITLRNQKRSIWVQMLHMFLLN